MSPNIVISLSILLFMITSLSAGFIGLNYPLLILNENQILYLYSTSSQVLAGVYGLTLTGFIFFRNELNREEFEDDTLTEAIENLKSRYFKLLVFITILSIFTFLVSNLVISYESKDESTINIILMNIAQSAFIVDLLVIAYFIFDVITPNRIEKESRVIQQKIDPNVSSHKKGSLEEFLLNFNKLEYILQKYGQAYQSQLEDNPKNTRRISNMRLAEFIYRAEQIDKELLEKIKNLVKLRNSIIHGAEPIVSMGIVESSKKILTELSKALRVKI